MSSNLIVLDLKPKDSTLRQFGFIALIGFGLLAACAFYEVFLFSFGLGAARHTVALSLALLGGLAALFSLVYPKANRVIYVAVSLLAYPIGFVLSYVIMALLFFGIFAPIGVILRLSGRDPMQRGFDRKQQSYWSTARPNRGKQSYFRQF